MEINSHFVEVREGSAASWTTTTNIMTADSNVQPYASTPFPRILRNVGLVGGAAAGATCGIIVKAGNNLVAQVFPSATSGLTREHLKPVDARIAENTQLSAYILAQSGTNALLAAFDFDVDYASMVAATRSRYSRSFQRRY